MQYINKKPKHYGRWIILAVIVLVLVAGGAYWWHRDHRTNTASISYQQVPTNSGKATVNPNVPGSTSTNNNPTTGASASKNQQSGKSATSPSSSVQPETPTGQFVSDHHPNLSGHPAPNTETSACTTTPGVKCEIKFTSGSTVKILPAQTTDSDGGTIWSNWTLQSIGLTAGTWTITAVAINGTKSATAQDAMQLVVAK